MVDLGALIRRIRPCEVHRTGAVIVHHRLESKKWAPDPRPDNRFEPSIRVELPRILQQRFRWPRTMWPGLPTYVGLCA